MRPLPLRWRVSLCAALTLIVTVSVISGLAYVKFRALLVRHIDDALMVVTRSAATAVDGTPDREEAAEIRTLMGPLRHERPFVFKIWQDGKSQDMYASDPTNEQSQRLRVAIAAQTPPAIGQSTTFGEGLGDQAYRAIWLRYQSPAGPMNIATAQFGHFDPKEIREFLHVLLPTSAGIVLLGGSAWLTGWSTGRCGRSSAPPARFAE